MRIEGDEHRYSVVLARQLAKPVDDGCMAYMNAIKRTCCNNRPLDIELLKTPVN
jgi:hypothetical protein